MKHAIFLATLALVACGDGTGPGDARDQRYFLYKIGGRTLNTYVTSDPSPCSRVYELATIQFDQSAARRDRFTFVRASRLQCVAPGRNIESLEGKVTRSGASLTLDFDAAELANTAGALSADDAILQLTVTFDDPQQVAAPDIYVFVRESNCALDYLGHCTPNIVVP